MSVSTKYCLLVTCHIHSNFIINYFCNRLQTINYEFAFNGQQYFFWKKQKKNVNIVNCNTMNKKNGRKTNHQPPMVVDWKPIVHIHINYRTRPSKQNIKWMNDEEKKTPLVQLSSMWTKFFFFVFFSILLLSFNFRTNAQLIKWFIFLHYFFFASWNTFGWVDSVDWFPIKFIFSI